MCPYSQLMCTSVNPCEAWNTLKQASQSECILSPSLAVWPGARGRCLYLGGWGGRTDVRKWSGESGTVLLALLHIFQYTYWRTMERNSVQILLCFAESKLPVGTNVALILACWRETPGWLNTRLWFAPWPRLRPRWTFCLAWHFDRMFPHRHSFAPLATSWRKNTFSQLGRSKNRAEVCGKIGYHKQEKPSVNPTLSEQIWPR